MADKYKVAFYIAGIVIWLLAAVEPRVPVLRRLNLALLPLGLAVFAFPLAYGTLKQATGAGPNGYF